MEGIWGYKLNLTSKFKFIQNPDDYDKKVGKKLLNDAGFQNLDKFLPFFKTLMIMTKKLEKGY